MPDDTCQASWPAAELARTSIQTMPYHWPMNSRPSIRRWIGAGIAIACVAGSAYASQPQTPAQQQPLRPPKAQKPEAPFVMNMLFAVVIIAGVMAVAVMPSKRGHQD